MRIAGFALLAMAMLMLCGFFRSYTIEDGFTAFGGRRMHLLFSSQGRISYWTWPMEDLGQSPIGWKGTTLDGGGGTVFPPGLYVRKMDLELGIIFGNDAEFAQWSVHYLVILFPLTVSTSLFLLWPSKQRPLSTLDANQRLGETA